MINTPYNIIVASPKSVIISFEFKEFNRNTISILRGVKAEIERKFNKRVCYTTTAFDALLVNFNENHSDPLELKTECEALLKNYSNDNSIESTFKTYEIPVCYKAFGQDLDAFSKHSGLVVDEVIKIHSEKIYTLYFIGFLPGFLYMGQVDERINMPRKKTPRHNLEKGSIAIAENQTGIYPHQSPGGWQVVGRTPIDIFNVNKHPPSLFNPGDQIKFKPINNTTFNKILNETNSEPKQL